ncbi:hypothetical protein [Hymenobacter psoromatis]|uniref:hypothetical protein n=1 Tax=Hymenobacter psoromatis TaxID=1484116 RepID=UPI001CBB7523|nr:hypothetical protein [Hymenobacter psoromatis]
MPTLNDQPNDIAGNQPNLPADETTKMGADARNTNANSSLQPATPAMQSGESVPTPPPAAETLAASAAKGPALRPADPSVGPAPTDPKQPDAYGGNFGNDVQNVLNDPARASNQRADANRGELGAQGTLGGTHGGFGNQYREFDTAAERPAAEATEEKYYGQGASEPGLQHNAYRDYDGRDERSSQQGHAVRDTPKPPTMDFGDNITDRLPLTDGRGNTQDNRNLPGKSGEVAAFQNDNGAPTVGTAYAPDYGHTSGVGLPAGTPDNHVPGGPGGRNQQEDQHSSRGGYDNQGSQGGRSHDQQPGGPAPAGQGAPAPVNAPDAPQNPGYGYGYARSEEAKPGNPATGDARNGFGPGGSKEGNTSQGYGSKGGSYDDQNPGARDPEFDEYTKQDNAKNYGDEAQDNYRPTDGDQPKDGDYGPAPRRNEGRDKE